MATWWQMRMNEKNYNNYNKFLISFSDMILGDQFTPPPYASIKIKDYRWLIDQMLVCFDQNQLVLVCFHHS